MTTFLFDKHIFGPIKSRRLGSSLGINLLSVNQKVCNFNCVYCECGLTHKIRKEECLYVDPKTLIVDLKQRLIECLDTNVPIDSITFAGNGEPTLHPDFPTIIDEVLNLRNEYFPNANVAVLTNGYTLDKEPIRDSLNKVERALIKLDAGDDKLFQLIDQPKGQLSIAQHVENIKRFKGKLIIQSMFLKGEVDGVKFDNSMGEDLENWLGLIEELEPIEVQLYSLDRATPLDNLYSVSKSILERIAQKLEALDIKTQVV